MKKFVSMLTVFSMIFLLFTNDVSVYAKALAEDELNLIFREENHKIEKNNFTNLNDKVDDLKGLEEGTIIVRFRYYNKNDVMSLFSLSNNTQSNGHFQMYITPSSIGSENRFEKPGEASSNVHVKANVNVKENEVHTLAMVMDKNEGYKYFLDGKLVLHDKNTKRTFMNNIYAPNSAQLGQTERAGNSNRYHFNGDIDFAEVYGKPLADQDLIDITGVTAAEPVVSPLPDGAMMTDPYSVFYPGLYGSKAYRIPALYNTMDGTLLAGIDKRIDHAGDSPANIDIIVRRSLDQGDTWEKDAVMVNDYPGYASNIDQLLLQDKETKRIFSLVLGFPEGGGYPTAEKGTGFTLIDGKHYMTLYGAGDTKYTVRENGVVFTSTHEATDYTVDKLRNLYLNGDKVSNIFLPNSPLKVARTTYLELWHSDDEGLTWDGPVDMNPGLKEEWMAFLGAGPGSGIQLTQGENAGRLVLPVYFTNENRQQASAVIYSDDNGETWTRGESPNHGRVVNGVTLDERTFVGNELTEAQVVEMPDGQLKMFMRNYSGFAQIATSFDGGETWDSEVVTERALIAPYSQMTAIRYDGQIDGKEAVIFASAGNSSQRVNGTVRAGLILEDGTYSNGRTKYKFDWKYSQLVKEGAYGYSSLTNLDDGNIGLLYENNTNMDFIKFNPEYLKWDRVDELPLPKLNSIAIESNNADGYSYGDKIRIKVAFDKYVMLSGDRSLTGKIGGKDVTFTLDQRSQSGTEYVFEGAFPELEAGEHEVSVQFAENLDIRNVFGQALDKSLDVNKLSTTVLATVDLPATNAADMVALVKQFEEAGEFKNELAARTLTTHLTAVSQYEKQQAAEKVVKHMQSFKLLLDQQLANQLISDKAYQALKADADAIIQKW
ncbi:sialidase domain-containing protein [Sporosarcina sp. NPDC096371]|uniref:sialidase domain-containing protein n=1 Tax=Sporosarcina sp. NPDC096371 TaxID=3364530 RepID=UPI0037F4B4F8